MKLLPAAAGKAGKMAEESFEYRGSIVRVIRQVRKTYRIDALADGALAVKAPRSASLADVRVVLEKNWAGIGKMRARKLEALNAAGADPIGPAQVRALTAEALKVMPVKARFFAGKLGVTLGRITVRSQTSRWGSCSSKGNLSFNCLLMLTPDHVQDYVAAHEVCHRLHMDHSAAFWRDVEKICPEWRRGRDYLKKNGNALVERMKAGKNSNEDQ